MIHGDSEGELEVDEEEHTKHMMLEGKTCG